MTDAKQFVLTRWPEARCFDFSGYQDPHGGFVIVLLPRARNAFNDRWYATGRTEQEAWDKAAHKMRRRIIRIRQIRKSKP